MKELKVGYDVYGDNVPVWERGQEGGVTRPINREALYENVCKVYDTYLNEGINIWLSHGTMLGVYRDGNFIEWDDDADLGAKTSERVNLKAAEIKIAELGFYIPPQAEKGQTINKNLSPWYDSVYIKDGEKIEIWWYDKVGDFYIYDFPRCGNVLKHPAKYYDTLDKYDFKGKEFNIPSHIEDWLVMMYGYGWNKPDKNKKYNHQS